MMRKLFPVFFFLLFLLLTAAGVPAAEPLVPRLFPQRAVVGRTIRYLLELPAKPDSRQLKVPQVGNLHWGGVSSEYRSVNFKASHRLIFSLTVTEAGRYTIPGWSLPCGGKNLTVAPVSFEAAAMKDAPAPQGVSYREAFTGEIALATPKKTFYVGEEIPVEVRLRLLSSARARVSYPVLQTSSGVIFRRYTAVNPQMPDFDQPQESQVERGGRDFQEIVFPAAFRVTHSDTLTVKGKVTLQIPEPLRRPDASDDDEDDFFGGSTLRRMMNFGRMTQYQSYTVTLTPLKNVKIQPLPPCPAGLLNTGLVGAWRGSCQADRTELRVGDALTLTLTLRGQGAVELWQAPTLKMADFRAYPPELQKNTSPNGGAVLTVRYALIALKEGAFRATFPLAWFDPVSASYQTIPCVWQGRVLKSDRPQAAVVAAEPAAGNRPPQPPPPPPDEPFCQKDSAGEAVALPWVRNVRLKTAGLLAAGAAAVLTGLLRAYRQRRNCGGARKRNAAAAQKQLVKRLASTADGAEFIRILREEGLPLLCDARNLPPGTAAEEAADNIPDDEVRNALIVAGVSGFCPGESSAVVLTAEVRKKVIRFFRKMMTVCLIFAAMSLPAADPELNLAYDRGDYQAAAKHYLALMKPGEESAALWYNYGGAMIRLKRWPEARYALLKAHLLSPCDTEILENLNFVNRKLRLEETGRAASPQEWFRFCRDRLRPDQYFLLLACWAALGLAGVSLPWARWWKIRSAAAAFILLLGTAALLRSAMAGPYHPQNAVVTAPQLELYTLPVPVGARVTATIPGGADAVIGETRGRWVRLRVNGRTGWALKTNVKALFPQGLW